jgi:hypothetical protein
MVGEATFERLDVPTPSSGQSLDDVGPELAVRDADPDSQAVAGNQFPVGTAGMRVREPVVGSRERGFSSGSPHLGQKPQWPWRIQKYRSKR